MVISKEMQGKSGQSLPRTRRKRELRASNYTFFFTATTVSNYFFNKEMYRVHMGFRAHTVHMN
jgi:hypothetical protein